MVRKSWLKINAAWAAAIVLLLATRAMALTVTGIGRYAETAPSSSAAELSGISYISGNNYYTVDDGSSKLFTLHIGIDPNSGGITSFAIDSTTLQLRNSSGTALTSGALDLEGVAYNPTNNTVYTACEDGPTLRQFNLSSGNQISQIDSSTAAELGVYANCRDNLKWESMTRQAGMGTFWTVNQEALTIDGPTSTLSLGGTIRLQKFAANGTPGAQYAYRLDGNTNSQWTSLGLSCVSDLLALPDGELVGLERCSGSGRPGGFGTDMRIRLYDIGFTNATNLNGGAISTATYVTKTLLWQQYFDASNNNQFEGITLGPTLANGDSSILLVADNGGGTDHTLYALRASGVPEPAIGAGLFLVPLLWRRSRRI